MKLVHASDVESLKDYVDNDDSVDLSEIVDFVDSFVIAALGEDADLSEWTSVRLMPLTVQPFYL